MMGPQHLRPAGCNRAVSVQMQLLQAQLVGLQRMAMQGVGRFGRLCRRWASKIALVVPLRSGILPALKTHCDGSDTTCPRRMILRWRDAGRRAPMSFHVGFTSVTQELL